VRAPVPEVQTFHDLKGSLHRRIIDRLDLAALGKLPPERLRDELRQTLATLLANEEAALTRPERERMVDELIDELTGLGPLEAVLRDPTVSDMPKRTTMSCAMSVALTRSSAAPVNTWPVARPRTGRSPNHRRCG
jgi:hypothetical protein